MDSETIEARAAEWFAKRQGDSWTSADEVLLDAWLDEATAHRVAFVRLEAAWQHSARLKALGAGVASGVIPRRGHWNSSPLTPSPPSSGERVGVRGLSLRQTIAAALVLLAATGWYFWSGDSNSYSTQVGSTETVPLSDGSQVTLNTDTEIRVALNEKERRIELAQGEAFFVVARDAHRPFTVIAGERRIVALGTRFSVRRDADDVRVAVTEGRVRLDGSADPLVPPTELSAGSVARTKDTAVQVQEKPLPEVEQTLSWRLGYVTFRDTDLAEAVAEFNRYSARKMVIEDPAITHIRIGGNFRTNNTEAFLWLLQNGFPVNVDERGGRIVLTRR